MELLKAVKKKKKQNLRVCHQKVTASSLWHVPLPKGVLFNSVRILTLLTVWPTFALLAKLGGAPADQTLLPEKEELDRLQ